MFEKIIQTAVFATWIMAGIVFTANAQSFKKIQPSKESLRLKAQGSFFVGGERVEQTAAELGSFIPAGHIAINQMYVRFMIPKKERSVPIIMIHGMALTGKTWETTPDGRMGWDEYFVRKGHAVYIPDQVSRGRSGFNQAMFNNVRTGNAQPNSLPPIWRFSDENTWPNFRVGLNDSVPFPDSQFPTKAISELSKQGVPDVSMVLPNPNPNYKALSDLAIEVSSAVLISHSQSGRFPLEAALINSSGIKAMILIEPGGCPNYYNDEQIDKIKSVPILVVFGDHLDNNTGVPGHSWQNSYNGCSSFITRVNTAGGNAKMLHLPEQGIKGNSHMIMQDKNNVLIADLLMKWISENVVKAK